MSTADDRAQDELNEAHEQADPAKNSDSGKGERRSNVDDVDKGAGVPEKDKKL